MAGFGHVLTAMVTPFDENLNVDCKKAADLARLLIASGSDGVVVAGTTGESPTLTHEEKVALFRAVVEAIGGKGLVIAGTGTNSTKDSIELTREAEDAGADGIMLVAPYYNKPPQDGLFRHFEAIAKETSLPIMLYNIPSRTGVNITPDTVVRLASIKNITAIKEASGNMDQVSEIRKRAPADFAIYSGDDSLTLPIMACGGIGVVSVASHVAGPQIKEMVDAYLAGDPRKATRIHLTLFPLFRSLFVTTNPIPVKFALRLKGFDAGKVRLPLLSLGEKEEAVVKAAMKEAGIL